uniref:SFRICE_001736 n=1 Tax=Spodoptera frugiperda TaxID=7108 RepID=A0A2H1V691_SPOFR
MILLYRGWVYKHTSLHIHDTQTRNHNLCITQRVAPCGIRTRYTLCRSRVVKLQQHLQLECLLVQSTKTMQFFFWCMRWVLYRCVYKHIISHTHDTQTQNNNLWITQKVAPCGNQTRYTLHGSRWPSYRANRAVKFKM